MRTNQLVLNPNPSGSNPQLGPAAGAKGQPFAAIRLSCDSHANGEPQHKAGVSVKRWWASTPRITPPRLRSSREAAKAYPQVHAKG